MEVSEFNGVQVLPPNEGGGFSTNNIADTFDSFLQLLTTQLEYQDPLSPLDSTQFTEQLVQFSGVEQSIATNDKLDQLIALQGGDQLGSAVSYIGKEIKADSDQIALQDGKANLIYGLEQDATGTLITIVNGAGQAVRVISGETTAGLHELVWDGKDAQGVPQPDGIYSVQVNAVDSENQSLAAATGTSGLVTGVESQDDEVFLKLGDLLVPVDKVFAVDALKSESQTS